MEAEARGKYAGVKLHLDAKECQNLLDWVEKLGGLSKLMKNEQNGLERYVIRTVKALKDLMLEHPDVLKDRTEEQIAAALARDAAKIEKQQAAMKSKQDWKKVK